MRHDPAFSLEGRGGTRFHQLHQLRWIGLRKHLQEIYPIKTWKKHMDFLWAVHSTSAMNGDSIGIHWLLNGFMVGDSDFPWKPLLESNGI